MKKKLNLDKQIKRILMVKSGAYDGRYKEKTYVDKKRNSNKYYCRKKDNDE